VGAFQIVALSSKVLFLRQKIAVTKEEYLVLAESKWPELKASGDFYAYEQRFSEIWLELGRAVLESSIGEVPVDHRKKKFPNPSRQNSHFES